MKFDNNKNDIEKKSDNSSKNYDRQEHKISILSFSNICFAIAIVLVTVGGLLITKTIHKGGEDVRIAYEEAKNKASDEAYNMFYETAYMSAERKYHVSNEILIEVDKVKERANLEVLNVSDVEYVIESRKNNNDGLEIWMEFTGEGVYTVDMKESEFIVDSDRQYVLVRVPRPELTNCRITNAKQLFWNNGILDKSILVGEEYAKEMRTTGYTKIYNYMKSNAQFYKDAKKSACMVIGNLVKGLNSDLTDLVVEVEFVD